MKYIRQLDAIPALPPEDRGQLDAVAARYEFRVSEYYLGLIDWDNPQDPLRRLIIPDVGELAAWGSLDASNEASNTVLPGLQHKYPDTVLLLCSEVCGGYCRYCFRKRLFMSETGETGQDPTDSLRYIAEHPEITNVLLTGGDPLMLSTRRLEEIIAGLRRIPHVRVIRLGSKMPAFNPWRILDDPDLLALFARYSTPERRIYLMTHFDHPRELTEPAVEALHRLGRSGVVLANQCPLTRGINDDPRVLETLFRRLSWVGCPPYYLFQCRPTLGNAPYRIPISEGWSIFQRALRQGSGLARRARFVMSHETGKIEILGMDSERIYLRPHRPKDPAAPLDLHVYQRDDHAYWLEDLRPLADSGFPCPAQAA